MKTVTINNLVIILVTKFITTLCLYILLAGSVIGFILFILIAAGGGWQKAEQLFQQMGKQGCKPDVVTYTSLISVFDKADEWLKALRVYEQMCVAQCTADAIVYNAIIDVLWQTGIVWAQCKVRLLLLLKRGWGRAQRMMEQLPIYVCIVAHTLQGMEGEL
jgi:pentatricopeptide repeat protein